MKKYLLCSAELPSSAREIFAEYSVECIDIPPCTRLQAPVANHPDMLFFKLADDTLLTEKAYFEENNEFFSSLSKLINIKTSDISLSEKYPCDIAFDALKIGDTLFCLKNHTAPEILDDAKTIINIKQGYARCSSLVIGDSVITSDLNIFTAVKKQGYDSLLISSGDILLPPYNCGFIGGASAVIESEKTVVFFGDISKHNNYDKLCDFCNKKGYKLRFHNNSYPKDFGGCLFFTV